MARIIPAAGAIFFFVLGLVVLDAARRAPQQDPARTAPRFQSRTDLVVLDVSVLDRDRRPVRGLEARDFVVLEDGQPQEVDAFSAVDLPDLVDVTETPAPWLRDLAPDVVRNTDFKDRQSVVIVMDDATPMEPGDVLLARRVGRQIVEQLRPGDMAAVAYVLDKGLGQEFTQDRSRLLAAIDKFNGAIPDGFAQFDAFDEKALTLYHGLLGTLRGIVEAADALRDRRKAVFLVSVGLPLDWALAQGQPISLMSPAQASRPGVVKAIVDAMEMMFDAARRANVNIYAFDPGGLRAPTVRAPLGGTPATNFHSGRLNQEFLQTLASTTGGLAVVHNNDPVPGIVQALRENRSYYLIGYAPANTRAQGRFRKVEVRVNRPELTVRTRSGYIEPRRTEKRSAVRTEPAAAFDSSITGVLPKFDELPLHVAAAPFAVAGKRAAGVAIVLGVRHPIPTRATRVVESVRVRADAYGANGKRQASRRETIPVTVNTAGFGVPVGYELLMRLDLPPGRYHLRLAAEASLQGIRLAPNAPRVALVRPGEDIANRSGSVYCDLDVPDFGSDPLTMSGVALGVTPPVVSGPKGRLTPLVPLVPTTLRDFSAEDSVEGFVRVYLGGGITIQPVDIDLTIRDWRDEVVARNTETLGADRFHAGAADYSFDLPFARFRAGPHVLTIEARTGRHTVRRHVRFTIH